MPLVNIIIFPGSKKTNPKIYFYIAAEVFSSNVWNVSDICKPEKEINPYTVDKIPVKIKIKKDFMELRNSPFKKLLIKFNL